MSSDKGKEIAELVYVWEWFLDHVPAFWSLQDIEKFKNDHPTAFRILLSMQKHQTDNIPLALGYNE